MDRSESLKFFIAVSLLGGACHCWEATVQKNVKAVKGSCVLVPCSTVSYNKVIWYKYQKMGYPTVYSKEPSEIISEFNGRTSVPGNARDGDCSLRIDNVRQADSEVGLYVWIWTQNENKGFHDRTMYITVVDPVAPVMSVESTPVVGRSFTATCKFRHSCKSSPPPITWLGLNHISNDLSHMKDAEGLWVTTATAKFQVNYQDQSKQLRCKSVLNGQPLYSSSESLNIFYAPTDVRIDYSSSRTITEGDNIPLKCSSNSKPPPSAFEWIVNQNKIQQKVDTLVLQDVKRHTSVTCIATNSIGSGQSSPLSLDVQYAPSDVKVTYTGSSTVVQGEKISLRCTSDSRPTPTHYEWRITRNHTTTTKPDRGQTVVLQDVKRETSVSCIAVNSIGKGQSKQLSLSVHYAPSDVKVTYTGSSTVVQGEKISLRCTSDSRPPPTHYEWRITRNHTTTTKPDRGQTVVLQDVKRDTSVSCIAANSIGKGQSKQLSLSVHYSPSILSDTQCSTLNNLLHCVCQAEAKPSAVISWTIDGSSAHFPPFNTTTQQNGSVMVSELTGPLHYNATCTAKNSVGTTFTELLVHSKVNTPITLVVGVLGAVVGLCVIVVLVFVIQKKRRRPQPHGELHIAQDMRYHGYHPEFDENVYANTETKQEADEDQDAESCTYENFSHKP